jgi:protein SCO1/2
MERKRVAEASKGVGRPKVGGPFSLLNQNGKVFTDGDMKGRYSLVRYPS